MRFNILEYMNKYDIILNVAAVRRKGLIEELILKGLILKYSAYHQKLP
jgi:hypothetical protein